MGMLWAPLSAAHCLPGTAMCRPWPSTSKITQGIVNARGMFKVVAYLAGSALHRPLLLSQAPVSTLL